MAKIRINVSVLNDAELLVEASQIIASMTGNIYFPNPVPPLSEVKDAYEAYDAAMAAMGTGKDATATKNKARGVLEQVLKELGLYVQLNGKGDEAILKSTGFKLASKPAPVGILPKPINFVAIPAEAPGAVKLSMKAIDGASSYLYEYTMAPSTPASNWEPVITPRASTVVDALTSGQKYIFRAVGIGANPTRIYSDEISSYVL